MTMNVCRIPGCPELQAAKLCIEHAGEANKKRGTRSDRGYGAAHDRERERIAAIGIHNFRCARCGRPFRPGESFDLGHTDDRAGWSGPEHPACNRGAAGKAAHMVFDRGD